MDGERPTEAPQSASSLGEETGRLTQALEDLSACDAASVSLVHCPSAAAEKRVIQALGAAARAAGFVSAEVSLRDYGLDSPDALVRAILGCLQTEGARPRDLIDLLETFWDQHGEDSASVFAKAAQSTDADGDLTALCSAYLATSEPEPEKELKAYRAFCDGTEPARKYRNRQVRRALSERTAQRVLDELSRVLGALGHRGLLVLLTEGDSLAARTDRQREKAFTVLRELVDNFDGTGGAIATRVVLTGQRDLFEGPRSIASVTPLRMRLEIPATIDGPPPPHRSWTSLVRKDDDRRHRKPRAPEAKTRALRNLVRISEGLPPTDKVTQMSVGQERMDRTIAGLFKLVNRAGRFFSVLVGEYGSGKTHLMMHLAERALEDKRPVFWLNLQRTNIDLGNPARHLSRFLEDSQLPLRGTPSALSLASRWTRKGSALTALRETLENIAAGDGEAAQAAKKALRVASGRDPGFALENFLSGSDLENRPGDASYRRDAYRRILLWFELLARLEEIRGPMILIDEAENLYTSGRAPASRRTSLRSLSFYCGGALPGACVVLAMTPPAFEELKAEARDLLAEADEMETTLELEDVAGFRRSLWGLRPEPVKALTGPERAELCKRVARMHKGIRGADAPADWDQQVEVLLRELDSPRALIRAAVDRLETAWWKR